MDEAREAPNEPPAFPPPRATTTPRQRPAHFQAVINEHDGKQIAALHGPLTAATAQRARATLKASEWTTPSVVVDLDGVTFIDSSGLSVLATLRRHLKTQHRQLAVVVTDPSITRLLLITGINQVIAVHATRADALRALSARTLG